jgi:hypothetical protein
LSYVGFTALCTQFLSFKISAKIGMNIASTSALHLGPADTATQWNYQLFVFLSTHCCCFLPRSKVRLDPSTPTIARYFCYAKSAPRLSRSKFLRRRYDSSLQIFCDLLLL